jgi:predicted RNA binding protein YcfA (HicA-like mRNA interferase family)
MPRMIPVDWKTLECVFIRAGSIFENQEGSHRMYRRIGTLRSVVIPAYREIPIFVIQNNLRTAGMTRDEDFRLLAECR